MSIPRCGCLSEVCVPMSRCEGEREREREGGINLSKEKGNISGDGQSGGQFTARVGWKLTRNVQFR